MVYSINNMVYSIRMRKVSDGLTKLPLASDLSPMLAMYSKQSVVQPQHFNERKLQGGESEEEGSLTLSRRKKTGKFNTYTTKMKLLPAPQRRQPRSDQYQLITQHKSTRYPKSNEQVIRSNSRSILRSGVYPQVYSHMYPIVCPKLHFQNIVEGDKAENQPLKERRQEAIGGFVERIQSYKFIQKHNSHNRNHRGKNNNGSEEIFKEEKNNLKYLEKGISYKTKQKIKENNFQEEESQKNIEQSIKDDKSQYIQDQTILKTQCLKTQQKVEEEMKKINKQSISKKKQILKPERINLKGKNAKISNCSSLQVQKKVQKTAFPRKLQSSFHSFKIKQSRLEYQHPQYQQQFDPIQDSIRQSYPIIQQLYSNHLFSQPTCSQILNQIIADSTKQSPTKQSPTKQSPTKYSPTKQQNKNRSSRQQNRQLMRSKCIPTTLLQLNQKKVFIINSQDTYIRHILQQRGWVMNPSLNSPYFHLKWNYSASLSDYKLSAYQKYNHLNGSHQLTSKVYLTNNLRRSADYYPSCYDISKKQQRSEFIQEYTKIAMYRLLTAIFHYVQLHRPAAVRKYIALYHSHVPFTLPPNFRSILLQDFKNYDQSFTLHSNLLLIAVRYWRSLRTPIDPYPQSLLDHNPSEWEANRHNLLLYSDSPFTVQLAAGFQREYYATPSEVAIGAIVEEYMRMPVSTYGSGNVWIVKPASSARGNGIYLETDMGKILTASGIQSRLVQKYVEGTLLLTALHCKKFDIRQWVLIKTIDPLHLYVFSHFYVRLCSEEYALDDIHNLKRHLTNYSFNKNNFKHPSQSVIDSETFIRMLWEQHHVDYKLVIEQQINKIIIESIVLCREQMSDMEGKCFELVGYDILIDERFKPWLLEVNMSPACEERTEWLKQYLKCMGKGLIDIVVGGQNSGQNINTNEPHWKLLIEESASANKHTPDVGIEIVGQQIDVERYRAVEKRHLKMEKMGEEIRGIYVESSIRNVQRVIRKYLKRVGKRRKCSCSGPLHYSYIHKQEEESKGKLSKRRVKSKIEEYKMESSKLI